MSGEGDGMHSTHGTAARGYTFAPTIQGDGMDPRRARIARDWAKVDGRRDAAAAKPDPRTPTVRTVTAKGRPAAAILAGLRELGDQQYAERYHGRPVIDGYWLVVTDGHFALLESGPGIAGLSRAPIVREDLPRVAMLGIDFFDVVRRVATCAPKTGRITLAPCQGGIRVSAEDMSADVSAAEVYPCESCGEDLAAPTAAFDVTYLRAMAGAAWTWQHGTGEAAGGAALFTAVDRFAAVVIMPMAPTKG